MTELEKARELALQRIGRNLVNFQKTDGVLRYLLAHSQTTVTTKGLSAETKKQRADAAKLGFGALAIALPAKLHAKEERTSSKRELVKELTVSTNFKLTGGKTALKLWRKDLLMIVKERNMLVHKMLLTFNPDSIQSCEALSQALDNQRARVLPTLERIKTLFEAFKELNADAEQELRRRFNLPLSQYPPAS